MCTVVNKPGPVCMCPVSVCIKSSHAQLHRCHGHRNVGRVSTVICTQLYDIHFCSIHVCLSFPLYFHLLVL